MKRRRSHRRHNARRKLSRHNRERGRGRRLLRFRRQTVSPGAFIPWTDEGERIDPPKGAA